MIQCICFSLYFLMWLIMGKELPEWLQAVNLMSVFVSMILSSFFWERHKERVRKLEEEIKRLKEKDNG